MVMAMLICRRKLVVKIPRRGKNRRLLGMTQYRGSVLPPRVQEEKIKTGNQFVAGGAFLLRWVGMLLRCHSEQAVFRIMQALRFGE